MKPIHKDWLTIAEGDLLAATRLLSDDNFTLGPSIFHTQQCIEKALKAFLIVNKYAPRKTHDLIELVEQCTTFDSEFFQLMPTAVNLNPHSTSSRYPDDNLIMPYRPDVETAIKQAEFVLYFIKNKIDLIENR